MDGIEDGRKEGCDDGKGEGADDGLRDLEGDDVGFIETVGGLLDDADGFSEGRFVSVGSPEGKNELEGLDDGAEEVVGRAVGKCDILGGALLEGSEEG